MKKKIVSNSKSGKIPLRIKPELHEMLVERADKEGRSLNSYLTKILEAGIQPKTFEDRQFVGQVILGENFDLSSRLVSVSGIYYRYLIDNADIAKADAQYVVIEANGNILTLRELK
ncbi:toxin-antitoxin system HicB family antitoxin [Leuconostoc miyukkimchii]|uniref:toxin-antitoxin system HicB family antitoxin n=1 Tax=Leuconostoc miyukkimchii TaxID=910540 RepID=UPI001C7D4FBC|nr:toxin-antitoxin system HicB family antitoxin [Leuconostoc miyukkimchii]